MSFPMGKNHVLWDEEGERVFVLDQFLSSERLRQLPAAADREHPVIFEFSLKTMRPTGFIDKGPVADGRRSNERKIICARYDSEVGALTIERGTSLQRYIRAKTGWRKVTPVEGEGCGPKRSFNLTVDQYVDRPAQLYAARRPDGEPVAIGEINEELKAKFHPSSYYEWTDRDGLAWHGGLIVPKDARSGERLPLIIQSHSFAPQNFVISGAMGTSPGFSAQALASAGFAVLVMGSPKRDAHGKDLYDKEREFEVFTEGYRSVIVELSKDGLIDRRRVGIIAWSRSGFWLQHALAFSNDLFAAAIAADASSFGKFYYLYFHNWPSGFQEDYLRQSGGAGPFGEGSDQWRQRDPVAYAAPFAIPILMEHYGGGLPSWWEPYVAMKEAGIPAEYLIMPNTPHDPVKVGNRYLVQTASVDWFRFWLQGYEDPEPGKADQYARWRAMRNGRCARENLEGALYCDFVDAK